MSIYPNLSNRLRLFGISYASLTSILNITEDQLSLKLQGLLPWKLWEVVQICRLLEMSDVKYLFYQLDSNT